MRFQSYDEEKQGLFSPLNEKNFPISEEVTIRENSLKLPGHLAIPIGCKGTFAAHESVKWFRKYLQKDVQNAAA